MSFDGTVVEACATEKRIDNTDKKRSFFARLINGVSKSSENRRVNIRDLITGEPHLEEIFDVVRPLVDAETIGRVVVPDPFPDEPRAFEFYGKGAGGIHFFDKAGALWAVVAESLERRIWKEEVDYFRRPATLSVGEALSRGGIDPGRFTGFSAKQRTSLPNLAFTKDSKFLWIEGVSHVSGRTVRVPAHTVSQAWFSQAVMQTGTEPYLRAPITTGLATGRTLKEATLRGLLEVIERDAFMISYLNQLILPRLNLEVMADEDLDLANVYSSFKRYRLEPHVILLLTDFDIPIALSVLIDRTGKGPAVSVGAKASFTLREALFGALSESLAVRLSSRRKEEIKLPPKEKFGRNERLAWWADPAQLPLIETFVQGPLTTLSLTEEAKQKTVQEQVAQLVQYCRKRGYEAVTIDLSSSKCNVSPLKVAFSMIPELQPLHLNEAYPAFAGARLTEVPQGKGYLPRKEIYREPHPFP